MMCYCYIMVTAIIIVYQFSTRVETTVDQLKTYVQMFAQNAFKNFQNFLPIMLYHTIALQHKR